MDTGGAVAKYRKMIRGGLVALAALAAGAAAAQPYGYPAQSYAGRGYANPYREQGYRAPQPYAYPSYPRQDDYAPQPYAQPVCCRVPAGTEVAVELVDAVGTHDKKAGERFALRLAAPLIVDGEVVIPAGTRGQGHVVQASGPGLGGKGAKLVVAADFLTVKGGTIPLQGLQLTGTGKDETFAADIASLAGWISAPLGLVGFAVTGGQIEIPAGAAASAKVAREVSLKPLGAAAAEDYAEVKAVFGERTSSHGWIEVPPPPPGQGQVVFFRIKAPANFGTWFNVRENGEALGKLGNGAYFIARFNPGVHTFTAKLEPEFKDKLTLKIDPGETYYVEGAMTHGALIGVADLNPSDKAHFDANSHDLEASAARPPTPDHVG
jgi:hypothetical protein